MNNEDYEKYEEYISPWKIDKVIGEGGYGTVFEISRQEPGYTYKAALKAITIPQTKSEITSVMADGMDEVSVTEYYKGFVSEITKECVLMSKFKGNSNIVSYEDHKVIEHKDDIGWDIFIRMELLTPMLKYEKNHEFAEQDVINLGIDICKALELCRKNNVIHRDIKPENIFVSDDGNFKLGDFGIARTIEKTTGGLSKTGTTAYMAPEVYKGDDYGFSVDIYSLGMVMYRCLNNKRTPFLPPVPQAITYRDREESRMRRMKGEALPKPVNGSDKLIDIVLKACAYKSSDRYSNPTEMKNALMKLKGLDVSDDSGEYSGEIKSDPDPIDNDDPQRTKKERGGDKPSPGSDIPPAAPNNKKISLKTICISAAAVIALALIGLAVFFVVNNGGNKSDADDLVFTLTPKVDALSAQIAESADIIDERLNVLGIDHAVLSDSNGIALKVDENALGQDAQKTEYIMNMITAKGDFNVIFSGGYGEFGKDGLTDLEILTENKQAFSDYYQDQLDITSDYTGFKEGFEQISNDSNISYIHAKLTDSASEDFQECLDYLDKAPTTSSKYINAVLDMEVVGNTITEEIDIGKIITTSNSDSSELNIVSNYADQDNITELIKHILSSESMPLNFMWELEDVVEFETGDAVTGKYQQESIDGKALNIEYFDLSSTNKDEEKYKKAVEQIKHRYDLLEAPYAIGYRGLDKKTLVVRISPEVMGSAFIRLIGNGGSISLCTQYTSVANLDEVKISKDASGNTCISALLDEYNLRPDSGISGNNIYNLGVGEPLYLVINDVTIAETVKPDLSAAVEEATIDFSNLSFLNKSSISNDDMGILNLIVECSKDTTEDGELVESWTIGEVTYCDQNGNAIDDDIPWGYDCESAVDKEVLSWIESTCPEADASLSYTSRNSLDIKLDLKVDNSLPEKFTSLVKQISTQCDFDGGAYQRVQFYIKGESSRNTNDRCRIGFTKLSLADPPTMQGYYYFTGPTFSKYYDAFENIIKTDPYFASHVWR